MFEGLYNTLKHLAKRFVNFQGILITFIILAFVMFPDNPFPMISRISLIGLLAHVSVRIFTLNDMRRRHRILVSLILIISGIVIFSYYLIRS